MYLETGEFNQSSKKPKKDKSFDITKYVNKKTLSAVLVPLIALIFGGGIANNTGCETLKQGNFTDPEGTKYVVELNVNTCDMTAYIVDIYEVDNE